MSHRFVGGWALVSTSAAAMFGLGWLLEPVQLPLWAVLVLVFVPAERTISLMTSILESAERRATGQRVDEEVRPGADAGGEPRRRER